MLVAASSYAAHRLFKTYLLCYEDNVCWCVLVTSRSHKDEVGRQVQDKLSKKTTENDECLPEVDTPNGSGIEEVKAFFISTSQERFHFLHSTSVWRVDFGQTFVIFGSLLAQLVLYLAFYLIFV